MDKVLREALEHAAKVFRRYAELHRDKDTPEGRIKAKANLGEALRCEDALTSSAQGVGEALEPYAKAATESAVAETANSLCVLFASHDDRNRLDVGATWARERMTKAFEAVVRNALVKQAVNTPDTPKEQTWNLMGGVPRCNACGYSARDCALHGDHRLCPNPDPPEATDE